MKDVDVIKAINDIREINRIEVNFSTNDPNNSGSYVVTNYRQIIRPDIITIEFNYE